MVNTCCCFVYRILLIIITYYAYRDLRTRARLILMLSLADLINAISSIAFIYNIFTKCHLLGPKNSKPDQELKQRMGHPKLGQL